MARSVNTAVAVALLAALAACKNAGNDDAADQRRFDSLVARRDTMIQRAKAQHDSLTSVLANAGVAGVRTAPAPVKTDSDLRETPLGAGSAGRSVPSASVTPPLPRAKVTAVAPVNASTQRAYARGDSIARAEVNKVLGSKPTAGATDSLRGVVQDQGPRAVIRTRDKLLIRLSGMANDGIANLAGAEIVVHGLKISSQDMVVQTFNVVAVEGTPVLDGRLGLDGTNWVLALSNGSGVQRLSNVPQLLQGATGARVWVTLVPGTTTPKTFGVIGRR